MKENKAKNKAIKKELTPAERHFGVVLENIDSKLDLVIEGHQTLDKKIDKKIEEVRNNLEDFRQDTQYRFKTIIEMTAKNTEDIEIVKETLNSHTQTLNSHTQILNSHTQILNSHTQMIAKNTEDIEIVKETLNSHTQILNSHTQMIAKNTEDIEIVKETLNSHTQIITKNAENLEIIKTDIEFIKNSLKKKVDIDEFSVLEKRVALLERKLQRA